MSLGLIFGGKPRVVPAQDWICAICREKEWNYTDKRVITLYTNNHALCKHTFHFACHLPALGMLGWNCPTCHQATKEWSILESPEKTQRCNPVTALSTVAMISAITVAAFLAMNT